MKLIFGTSDLHYLFHIKMLQSEEENEVKVVLCCSQKNVFHFSNINTDGNAH